MNLKGPQIIKLSTPLSICYIGILFICTVLTQNNQVMCLQLHVSGKLAFRLKNEGAKVR